LGLPHRLRIWNSHGDHVRALPAEFHVTGETGNAVSAAEDPARKLYAVQFHPEVRHTDCGAEILRNFVFGICHARPLWSGTAFIAETVESIRRQVGESRAICALSGGVDSAVAAVLVHRAIGDRLTNVFVNNGPAPENEFRETLELLRERMGLKVEGWTLRSAFSSASRVSRTRRKSGSGSAESLSPYSMSRPARWPAGRTGRLSSCRGLSIRM